MSGGGPIGDAHDREALQFIAEGVVALAGFDFAAIGIVHRGQLWTIAAAGRPDAVAALMDATAPMEEILAVIAKADAWGMLSFIPHDRQDAPADYDWVPEDLDYDPDDPDAWHPEDQLCALLYDEDRVVGMLSMDVPRSGRRPSPEQRKTLEVYAAQAGRAIVTALDRGVLTRGLIHEREVSEYRGRLLDVISHDLRNPIGAIQGQVEMLRELPDLPAAAERGLASIERASFRAAALMEDLLALARSNRGESETDRELVDLAVLVRRAVELHEPAATRSGITISCTETTGTLLYGDRIGLESLVGNLISNAVKYSDAGGSARVWVGGLPQGSATEVGLEVSDDGIGIGVEDQHRLFDEFFRSTSRQVQLRPGSGLGLAIAQSVVRRHHGSIEVDSELGRGATFRVRLPVDRPAPE